MKNSAAPLQTSPSAPTDNAHVPSQRRFSAFPLLIALLALCAAGKPVLYDTLDPDCFWHLKVAEQLHQDGIGPLVDHLSFASDKTPWTPYSWLAELGMKWIWNIAGYRGAILTQAILSAAFVIIIAMTARIRSGGDDESTPPSLNVAIAAAFAAFLSLAYISFRPASLAIVLLSLCYFLIHRDRSKQHQSLAIWFIIPLTAILANVHLFVFLVPLWMAVILVCHGVGADHRHFFQIYKKRQFLLFLATLAAACATPMLPGAIHTLFHYQFADVMVTSPVIAEMQPFWSGTMGKVSLVLVIAFFASLLISRRKLDLTDFLLLAGSTILLFMHGRYAPLFAIVAAPILTRTLPRLSEAPLYKPAVTFTLGVILIVGVFRTITAFPPADMALGQWLNRHDPPAPGYPAQAADYLAAHVPPRTGRLINEFTWGGYLAWRIGDHYQVLLDGRTQLYAPNFWQATYLSDAAAAQSYLATQPADAAVLPAQSSRFAKALLNLGWHRVYEDDRAQILIPPEPVATSRF